MYRILLLLLAVLLVRADDTLVDLHDDCTDWATRGECAKNPRYMLQYCARSCSEYKHNNPVSHYVTTMYSYLAETAATTGELLRMLLGGDRQRLLSRRGENDIGTSQESSSDHLYLHVEDLDDFDIPLPDESDLNEQTLKNNNVT